MSIDERIARINELASNSQIQRPSTYAKVYALLVTYNKLYRAATALQMKVFSDDEKSKIIETWMFLRESLELLRKVK